MLQTRVGEQGLKKQTFISHNLEAAKSKVSADLVPDENLLPVLKDSCLLPLWPHVHGKRERTLSRAHTCFLPQIIP